MLPDHEKADQSTATQLVHHCGTAEAALQLLSTIIYTTEVSMLHTRTATCVLVFENVQFNRLH